MPVQSERDANDRYLTKAAGCGTGQYPLTDRRHDTYDHHDAADLLRPVFEASQRIEAEDALEACQAEAQQERQKEQEAHRRLDREPHLPDLRAAHAFALGAMLSRQRFRQDQDDEQRPRASQWKLNDSDHADDHHNPAHP